MSPILWAVEMKGSKLQIKTERYPYKEPTRDLTLVSCIIRRVHVVWFPLFLLVFVRTNHKFSPNRLDTLALHNLGNTQSDLLDLSHKSIAHASLKPTSVPHGYIFCRYRAYSLFYPRSLSNRSKIVNTTGSITFNNELHIYAKYTSMSTSYPPRCLRFKLALYYLLLLSIYCIVLIVYCGSLR